eukprot:m.159231 g.159231  ORF g.159231 m.159231 type:complete len:53 (-) comp14340_c0_seq39:3896-4054(-)
MTCIFKTRQIHTHLQQDKPTMNNKEQQSLNELLLCEGVKQERSTQPITLNHL